MRRLWCLPWRAFTLDGLFTPLLFLTMASRNHVHVLLWDSSVLVSATGSAAPTRWLCFEVSPPAHILCFFFSCFYFSFNSPIKCQWCSMPTMSTHWRPSSPTAMNTSPQARRHHTSPQRSSTQRQVMFHWFKTLMLFSELRGVCHLKLILDITKSNSDHLSKYWNIHRNKEGR